LTLSLQPPPESLWEEKKSRACVYWERKGMEKVPKGKHGSTGRNTGGPKNDGEELSQVLWKKQKVGPESRIPGSYKKKKSANTNSGGETMRKGEGEGKRQGKSGGTIQKSGEGQTGGIPKRKDHGF